MSFETPRRANPRYYAIIPAAGSSRRMGRPKLLLPWPTTDRPEGLVIDQVLSAWTTSCVSRVVVVVRADDQQLAQACERWQVDVVRPQVDPADMKESIQWGLRYLSEHDRPASRDGCFFAPADLPGLSASLINRLCQHATQFQTASEFPNGVESITVPVFGDRRGHPVLFPWSLTHTILTLPADIGIDSLVHRQPLCCLQLAASESFDDVDTPEEYRQALTQLHRHRDESE